MSMTTKANPSASASTTGSPESDPRDPAVVALMERVDSRVAGDHTSFVEILYGTDIPGGKTFAEVLKNGYRRGYSVMSLSRQHVNEPSELSALGISLGKTSARSLLGKLHTDQEDVPPSITSWERLVGSGLSVALHDAFVGDFSLWKGPPELENWPHYTDREQASITWQTAFNLLSPDEPADILDPDESLPAPPPRYIWRGSHERVDNIAKAMHDALDSVLEGPKTIPGANTWGARTIYRLEPVSDSERVYEDYLSKESQQLLDRVERSTDLCDLVLSAFNYEPGSNHTVNDLRQELNKKLGKEVFDHSFELRQTTGKADKTFVGNISTGLHNLSSKVFEIVTDIVEKQYQVKHGDANKYRVIPYSLRGLVDGGHTEAKMRWDKTFNVLSSQYQELEWDLSNSPPTSDGRSVLLVYPASQPPSGRHQTSFSVLQTAIMKAREGPKVASQVSKQELAQSDRQWRDEYNRSVANTSASASVDSQTTPSKVSSLGKKALRDLFSRH